MGETAALFGFGREFWYKSLNQLRGDRVKRVNLLDYFELAEALAQAKRATSLEQTTTGLVYMGSSRLLPKLRTFTKDDNGFSACKHVANTLANTILQWNKDNLESDGKITFDKWEVEVQSWQYASILAQIDSFRTVFEAESRDVDVYSVGEVSIYKTSALVSRGAEILPHEIRSAVKDEVIEEFNNAGRCLAFSLPTACGFHALRGLELVMDSYLDAFGVDTSKFKSWNDYIQAAEKLIDPTKGKVPAKSGGAAPKRKPTPKVATMLDRMRELDRNPLMHPRNVLDDVGADMLYKLAAITVIEMIRDMPKPVVPMLEIISPPQSENKLLAEQPEPAE